jgi:hypothetical protein
MPDGDRPANPVAGIPKEAENVKALSRGRGLGEGERQKHFCPVQKIFAPLRLGVFAPWR